MTTNLKKADVERLIAQPSPHMRAVVAGKLAHELHNPELTASELEMAQELVRTMAQDAQMIVRQALAHNLRRSNKLPHDVALRLANDVEAVALPILLDSEILTDEDLLQFIRGGAVVKQKAIASRPKLSQEMIDEIINTTNEVVVATLMRNEKAAITDPSLHRVMARFSTSDMVKESMARRPNLPISVTEKLVTMVSAQMRNYLINNQKLPEAMAMEFAKQGQERATIQLTQSKSQEEVEGLVQQMHADKRLTPSLVVRALCMGNMMFFEHGLAALAGVPIVGARALIHDPGPNGLNSLWEKSAMPPKLMPLARTALDVMRKLKLNGEEQDIQRFRSRIIERMISQMGNASQDELDYLMDLLQ